MAASDALNPIDRSDNPGLHMPSGDNRYGEHTRELTRNFARKTTQSRYSAGVSGEAKSPSGPAGQMPPSFDKDVARVVAEIDQD